MRFGVLGPLAVWTDQGEPVTVPGRKVRALLADLLVHEGRAVSVDRLVEDLWGDAAPADPTAALHVRVSQLRRALADGRELVVSQAPGYALRTGEVDVTRFASVVERAQATDDARGRAALLTEALNLWRGPALADFADEEFASSFITRWEEQRLSTVESQAEALLVLGEHASLVGSLGEQVAAHPYRERLRAAHMRALHRSGRTGEALDSFAELRTQLADELGLDPSPELTALHRSILAGDPAEDAQAPAPRPARPTTNLPAPVTELIGREHAVARVEELLAAGRLVTLTGPGGVGKTSVAVAAGHALAGTYPDGVWLVDLTTWDGEGDPAELVLSALSIPDNSDLAAALRERRMLLVLDNCEHVIEPVADLVGTLLPAAPDLRVLATSREPLRLRGETRYDLPPLDIPDTDDPSRLAHSPAVRLFLTRAGMTAPPEPAPTVAGGTGTAGEAAATGSANGTSAASTLGEASEAGSVGLTGLGLADSASGTGSARGDSAAGAVEMASGTGTADSVSMTRSTSLTSGAGTATGTDTADSASVTRSTGLADGTGTATGTGSAGGAGVVGAAEVTSAAEVCRRLDGIPLALELAAGRVPALGVAELAARLRVPHDRFGLLGAGPRDAPARQRTLAAVIDWSWRLLTDAERAVLRRLAVHSGGSTLAAAEAVCAGDGIDVLDLLAGLVDRSLVVRDAGSRFRLLESVAAFCGERLREAGEETALRLKHAEYYLTVAEGAEPRLRGPEQREWLRRLDAETANLRAAFDTFVRTNAAEQALRLAVALVWYWFLRGRLTEAWRELTTALAVAGEASATVRAEAEVWSAGLAIRLGQAGPERVAEVLRWYDKVADPVGLARAQWFLAASTIDFGDVEATGDLLAKALDTFESVGDRWGEAAVLSTRAMLAHMRFDGPALEHDARRAAELFTALGDDWGVLQAEDWLIGLADMTGDPTEATRLARAGLRTAEDMGLWTDVAGRLGWLAWLSGQVEDYPSTLEYAEQALKLAADQGRAGEVFTTLGLAGASRQLGQLDRAEKHLRWLLATAREQQTEDSNPPYLTMVLLELGLLAEQRGNPTAALNWHQEGFAAAKEFGSVPEMGQALAGMAAALALTGRGTVAAQLLGAAKTARQTGPHPSAASRTELARVTALVETAEPDFAAQFALGAELTPEQARSLLEEDRA